MTQLLSEGLWVYIPFRSALNESHWDSASSRPYQNEYPDYCKQICIICLFILLRTGLLAKKDRLVSGKHQAVRERELPRIRGSFYPRNGRLLTRMDSFIRALCLAGTAIQTCVSIDYIFSITLADSVSRTDCCTGTAGYTLIRNYICHNYLPPCKCTCIGSF